MVEAGRAPIPSLIRRMQEREPALVGAQLAACGAALLAYCSLQLAHSARRPRERAAADEVEVEVEHALARALAVVAHEAEVVEPLLLWG